MKRLFDRIRALERRLMAKLLFWPDDSDRFLEALGVDTSKYAMKNADGSTGFDFITALADTAAQDWNDTDFIGGENDGREKS